jgi:antitoxin component of RelBE/YafQ-DinJ toxin-antitoxin module
MRFLVDDIDPDEEELEEILDCIQLLTKVIKTGEIPNGLDLKEENTRLKKRITELEARLEEDQEEETIINSELNKRKKNG